MKNEDPPDTGVPFQLPSFAIAGFGPKPDRKTKSVEKNVPRRKSDTTSIGDVGGSSREDLAKEAHIHTSSVDEKSVEISKQQDISSKSSSRRSSGRTIKHKQFPDELVKSQVSDVTSSRHDTDKFVVPSSTNRTEVPKTVRRRSQDVEKKKNEESVIIPKICIKGLKSAPYTESGNSKNKSKIDSIKKVNEKSFSNNKFSKDTSSSSIGKSMGNNITSKPTLKSHSSSSNLPQNQTVTTEVNPNTKAALKRIRGLSKRGYRIRHEGPWKDLSRWKAVDDLALIQSTLHTNDLLLVHKGVKFTCHFTLQEVQERWNALMYEPKISCLSMQSISALNPEVRASVERSVIFNRSEIDLIVKDCRMKANVGSSGLSHPPDSDFKQILYDNSTIFHKSRNVSDLKRLWFSLKMFSLLQDQHVQPLPKDGHILNFGDAEFKIMKEVKAQQLNKTDPLADFDTQLDYEMASVRRKSIHEIRKLECEISRWQTLLEKVRGTSAQPEFDSQTLAVLRGRLVRYLMRNREITIGRSTGKETTSNNVDIDLKLEGPAHKISRRQGVLRLEHTGQFRLVNEGERPFYVNGSPVLRGQSCYLVNQCVIQIANLQFVFLVNLNLMKMVYSQSQKMFQASLNLAEQQANNDAVSIMNQAASTQMVSQ